MANLLSATMLWGTENFGIGKDGIQPAVYVFGFPIYFYAICIVTGMCLAILTGALYFKKRGYDPYDMTIYALALIPLGVLGARAYVYVFPWAGETADWSTFFQLRDGGLGIYGGVIVGYIAAFVTSKIKKQDFRIITDSILPGVLLAQSIGRWGNYFNQEAYGRFISSSYDALPHAQSGLFSNFNGYAVWIERGAGGWYEATFFYESVCTFLGFLICVLVLTRSKHYRLGWCTAFYGIYYGIARLVIEGFRTDSLYLFVGTMQTDIKISQLVSIAAIIMGVWTLTKVYRKELHALYKKMFKTDYDEIAKSRWIVLALAIAFAGVAATMFALGGETKFIIGFVCALLSVYCALGCWSLFDRLTIYNKATGNRTLEPNQWQTDYQAAFMQTVCYGVAMALLFGFGLFSLAKWGIVDGIANGTVLAVVCMLAIVAMGIWLLGPALAKLKATQGNKSGKGSNLNKFLLFVFPAKVYADYTVDKLTPWVDPKKAKKQAAAQNDGAQAKVASQDADVATDTPDTLPTDQDK